ncbi:MAG: hypothetical protein PHU07_04950 [Acidocella sp.]|nr:hypothetical protein [Acidocella sp.]
MLSVGDLAGLWTRSLLVLPDGTRDTATEVVWLQGPGGYADLRQAPGQPDFSHVRCLDDLTAADCAWLATQQGFAGTLSCADGYFEWGREIDYQPPAAQPDSGRLFWQGDILVETGRYADYLERWHRDPACGVAPCGEVALVSPGDGRPMRLVRTGDCFMFACGRAETRFVAPTLAECVAGAADLATARALLDCEISFGRIAGGAWRILRSTLPFRVGAVLDPAGMGTLGLRDTSVFININL